MFAFSKFILCVFFLMFDHGAMHTKTDLCALVPMIFLVQYRHMSLMFNYKYLGKIYSHSDINIDEN